jgi:formiminotetrahydrofolate cyclodeaminase
MPKRESQKEFWKRLSLKKGRSRAKGKRSLITEFISTLVYSKTPDFDNNVADKDRVVSSFIEDLARAQPDPGGGSAAAYGITLSLALVEKVVRLELQRAERQSDRIYLWENSLAQLRQLRVVLAQLQERDIQAYFKLMEARAAAGAQSQEMLEAVQEAVNCPLQIMKQAMIALAVVSWTGGYCRKHLVSDLLVSCEMIRAALQGAYHIACANLDLLDEPSCRQSLEQELTKTSQEGRELFLRVREKLESRE